MKLCPTSSLHVRSNIKNAMKTISKMKSYAVAHKVCHLKIPNHLNVCRQLWGSAIPKYEEKKEWLRINKQYILN